MEKEYKENNWLDKKLNINGSIPKYIGITFNKEGKYKLAITYDTYCSIKDYNNKITTKK